MIKENFKVNKKGDNGRDLINQYAREISLIIGKSDLDLNKITKYLEEQKLQPNATKEEISEVIRKINESAQGFKTSQE